MIMSRAKGTAKPAGKKETASAKLPQLEEYIKNRDYSGALTLLEFNRRSDELEEEKKQKILMCVVDWPLCIPHRRLPEGALCI